MFFQFTGTLDLCQTLTVVFACNLDKQQLACAPLSQRNGKIETMKIMSSFIFSFTSHVHVSHLFA